MDRVQIAEIKALQSGEVQVTWIIQGTIEIMRDLRTAEEFIFANTFGDVTICGRKSQPGVLFVSQDKEEVPVDATVYVNGVARIGNGTKLHRARKDYRYGIIITCNCPGTRNGHAKISGFWTTERANCGN